MNNSINIKSRDCVIVAHPLQQHSYSLGTALQKNGLLHSYCTTIYYTPQKILYRILGTVLGDGLANRMKGRKNKFLENRVRQFDELLGLIFMFLLRIDKKRKIEPHIYEYLTDRFGRKVAKYAIQHNVEAVILYDTTSCACFEILAKKSNIIKIIDMSSAAAPYVAKIIEQDKDINHAFISSHESKMKSFSDDAIKKYEKEILLADYFLVPSDFVRRSLLEMGIRYDQTHLVPYGVDLAKFSLKAYSYGTQSKITFLYSGRIEAAKGIYYLLEAFKQLNRQDIQLYLVGSMQGQEELFEPYKQYFTYIGVKHPDEMSSVYQSADIFVFPSLYEGFSGSVLEAMATGLPVIVSNNSGFDDVISSGREGFIIPIMDIEILKKKIEWFCENKVEIPRMGKNARETVETYTWQQYEENVSKALKAILSINKGNGESFETIIR